MAFNNKSVHLAKLERFNESIECFQAAINLNPKYIKAYNNKGNSLAALNMFYEANWCFDKSLEIELNTNALILKGKL